MARALAEPALRIGASEVEVEPAPGDRDVGAGHGQVSVEDVDAVDDHVTDRDALILLHTRA